MYRTRIALLLAALSLAAAPLAAQIRISPGQTVTGELDESDPQMEDGAYYEVYVIRGRPGERVVVQMRSEEFDTYLQWGSEAEGDWVQVAGDDDGGEGTDSRLIITLGEPGEFELRAAGFAEDDLGRYHLQVSPAAPLVPGRIRVGETVRGELSESDAPGDDGPEDHYVIRGEEGSTFTAYLESDDFDTFLVYGRWRDGALREIERDDDGGEGTNSMLVAELGRAEHRLVVRSYFGNARGSYTLRVEPGGVPEYWEDDDVTMDTTMVDSAVWDPYVVVGEDSVVWAVVVPTTDTVGIYADTIIWTDADTIWAGMDTTLNVPASLLDIPLVFAGSPVEGMLGDGEERGDGGVFYHEYAFYAGPDDQLRIELTSDEFDPVVSIGLGRGERYGALEEDDDSGPGLNARVRFSVPQEGFYVIRVTSAAPEQTGPYVLLVRND